MSREESLNSNNGPGLEHRTSRFHESNDSAETRQWDNSAMHDTDPALSLVSSNAEDIIPGPEALAATRPQA